MRDSMRTPGDSIALTPMQSWMFYESVPAERPWVNLQQAILRLDGQAVSLEALETAWTAVTSLHPALRASIRWRKLEKPVQVVADAVDVDVDVEELDWQDQPANAQEDALEDFLARDRHRGIDIEAAPHWRVSLIRLAPTRSVMIWTVHNALIDGTSVGIVLEDLFSALDTGAPLSARLTNETYRGMCEAIAAPADPSAKPLFADYLDGFEPLGLSSNRTRNETDWHAEFLVHVLDRQLTSALKDAADRCGGTLRNLIEAAWGLMLARWQNAPDLVFGVTGGGRNLLPDGARAAGCFLNTLPRRMKIGRDTTLGSAVQTLKADSEAMRPFEQVSVAQIRKFCNLHGASYLFDTVVMFDRGSMSGLFKRAGAHSEGRSAELRSEIDLPLSLGIYSDAEMRLELEADPAVVPADRARRMLDDLIRLLVSIAAAEPGALLRDLDMLGDQRAEVMTLGEPVQGTVPIDFLDRFREGVARDPDAIAIQQAGQPGSLSYGALDAVSDRLAAHLQAKGAGPGDIVAIHLGRRPEYFVALIAVLKTGAAFLPVDPGYPDAVIAHMVGDSGTRLVISDDMEVPASGAEVIAPQAGAAGAVPAPIDRDPAGPAYVIYTSGSTGKPKGVVIPDRAMVGHCQAITRLFDITAKDRVYQFMSLSFDFSLEEILPTLYNGATLVLRGEGAALSGADFVEEISTLGLTVMHLPTAFFHIATDYLTASGAALPESLRLLNIGGERANPQIVQDWLSVAPDVRLFNGYGPTETAITVTFYELGSDLPEGDVPIGTAADHALCYIAAPDGSLSPREAIGELWIGGVAVGIGYHGLPEKTADVFFDDHFRGTGRVYRTGDRASWRVDGNLNFFGRNDRQVKVRGFRIDLGHVERVLENSQPELRVFAGVRDAGKPSARLLAWAMIAEGGDSVDLDALKSHAEAELPPQMRPRIVVVDDFPRTAGGKVNLAALPDPGHPTAPTARSAPMTELEAQIAKQIGEVLMVENVGAEDDFYDLGGHSLLAAELVGRIEVKLGHKVSVVDLQRQPTAQGLADVVERGSTGPRNIFEIQPKGCRSPLFGVHILGGLDSYYTALADELGPDQPVLGVTIGALARDKPIGVEETAKRYFDEIQKFHPDGPVHLAAVSLGAYFAWELAWMLNEAGREIGHFALFDADGPGGRDARTGLAGVRASIQTVQQRGYGAIPVAIHNRIQEFRYARIAARMKKQAETGEGIDIRDGNDFIASNDLAVESYAPKPLAVPFTIYRSNENFFDTEEGIRSGLGWESVALAGYEVIDVPGGHLTMLEQPNAKTLASHVARAMNS
ncbi:MAG TPA: non-ribosomal peptide synthetase [Rhodobacteraceae bacterium]|nr:non-ribosomal peptide synthetase [Paracoccaceae bacterium]